ncbi:MAG: hypothetical protein L3J83_05835 [Proteobacteria bacterium]|nr:hypothetical protein [Pseudomonadota bacterium]
MIFPPDRIEKQISCVDQAWELLNFKLPQFNSVFSIWHDWFCETVTDKDVQMVVSDALIISYARMALRNGSLSKKPRSYHSEKHIDDLLYRLIAISHMSESQSIADYGWLLLSLFMCGHDLRQSKKNNESVLIGDNEQASFQEMVRILEAVDSQNIVRNEHKELLKLMIHGSTFGKGEDTSGNIYQGNLVKHLLKNVRYFEDNDKQLAYLACDIDTANVAANLPDYAQSSINVYNEIQNFSQNKLSAQTFFGEMQEQYFFELQSFNSKIGVLAFDHLKQENAPKIELISQKIKSLDKDLSNQTVVDYYLSQIKLMS